MYPACCIFRISLDKLYPNISKEHQTSTQYLVVPHKPFQMVPAHFAPGPLQRADRHKDAAIRRPDGFGTGFATHKIPQRTSLPR